jgi:signal transduction histidine kinase
MQAQTLYRELLEQIRPAWLSLVAEQLAPDRSVRDSFLLELDRFFDCLLQSVASGDPAGLNPLLLEWLSEPVLAGQDEQQVEAILLKTYQVAGEELGASRAYPFCTALLPVFTRALVLVSQKESERVNLMATQELERAKESLEQLDQSKSSFVAIAAHELKTPLTLVEGYSSMLADHLATIGEEGDSKVLLKGIRNGTRRLLEIVDDLIDVSMIDNDLLELHFQPVWIGRLLGVIALEFRETLQARQLSLEIADFEGSQELTFGDEERLYQAFRNLISNAIKFTPDGGKIKLDGRKLPGFVEVIVSDSGIGIDPEDQDRIFDRFSRLGNITTHSSGKTKFKGGGPGLGLSITKGIIERHGGAIWVESDGHNENSYPGTNFHILLPLRKQPPDPAIAKIYGPLVEAQQIDIGEIEVEGLEKEVYDEKNS